MPICPKFASLPFSEKNLYTAIVLPRTTYLAPIGTGKHVAPSVSAINGP